MREIGRAVARLARRVGGQLMLELPDDLDPAFLESLLAGANEEVPRLPKYALLVRDQREDVSSISPSCDFHELAMYRQGERLAFTFASDNSGMATYSSVYPLLLHSGFPAEYQGVGPGGVACLQDFGAALGEVLSESVGTFGLVAGEFHSAVAEVLSFLARAYEAAGNGQASFAADWWLHVGDWVESLKHPLPDGAPAGVARIYGSCGLPCPADGLRLRIAPKDYVAVLRDRWGGPSAIVSEIGRLGGIESARGAAELLGSLDWEQSHAASTLRSDSPVARVAMAPTTARQVRASGWGLLGEHDFAESFVDARGKLRVLRSGAELPSPWKGAPAVIAADASEEQADGGLQVELREVSLIIPYKASSGASGASPEPRELASLVEVEGGGGCRVAFALDAADWRQEGLQLTGLLRVAPAGKSPNAVTITAKCSGRAAALLVDRCSGSFTLVRTTDAVLWARPSGRATRGAQRGPLVWPSPDGAEISVELPRSGSYDVAIALGTRSGLTVDSTRIGSVPLTARWPGMSANAFVERVDITEEMEVSHEGECIFRLGIAATADRPLSPVVAAAHGVMPDTRTPIPECTLGMLEELMGRCLEQSSGALGAVVASDSSEGSELQPAAPGTFVGRDLRANVPNLTPGLPSESLLSRTSYNRLRDAYAALEITKRIAAAEEAESSAGLTVSRIPLDQIDANRVEELLNAYVGLLNEAAELSPTDRFWARHPFSVAVFPAGNGVQSASAVLLSPLHPVRLAWLWSVQVGLRAAFDDGVAAGSSLQLLDGVTFPAYSLAENAFGATTALMPLPVDAHPEDLYVGWHVSVATPSQRPTVPRWLAGHLFPVDGLSALSPSAVSAAIDDFLRVSPHVQSLTVELAAVSSARRSSAIDGGVLAKLRSLAVSSRSLDGVAGVRVRDSANRLGEMPRLEGLDDAISVARPGFNAEWTRVAANSLVGSHVTFLEGSAATVTLDPVYQSGCGWLPELPLRRIPRRSRQGQTIALEYSLSTDEREASAFARALAAYEGGSGGSAFTLRTIPNLAGISSRPNWLVAADFGVDPQSLSRSATLVAGTSYVLWDWRPVPAVRANDGTSGRVQPYFVVASVPDALSSAIRDRLRLLKPDLPDGDLTTRASFLVATLAERAIGLNTLLAIGHHQSTGALGFFFALRSLESWMTRAGNGELRLVIPVDAVDGFLRLSATAHKDEVRKRADLIAIRAWLAPSGEACVVMVPVEIKHYGLGGADGPSSFPTASDARMADHVDQLAKYQEQLVNLAEAYSDAAGIRASVLGQRLATLIDAAVQLSPNVGTGVPQILASVASGRARVEVGKGLLAWYQAGASGPDGATAEWEEVLGTQVTRRVDVRVDPASFDAAFWEGEDGACHTAMRNALDAAAGGSAVSGLAGAPDAANLATPASPPSTAAKAAPSIGGADAMGLPFGPSTGGKPTDAAAESIAPLLNPALASPGNPEGAEPVAPRVRLAQPELERRYTALLGALREFGVKVERPIERIPFQEGPGFIEYAVQPAYGVSVSRVESQVDNLKLRLKLPADAVIGCSTHLGNILVTVPKFDAERYFVDAQAMWARWAAPETGFSIPLGEDISGEIVSVDLASPNSPHILIAGVTGSGKSEALLTMLHGAVRFNSPDRLQLLLVDPKQTELVSLASCTHLRSEIGSTSEDAILHLESAVHEMESRYLAFKDAGPGVRSIAEFQAKGGTMARWLVVLDEYADLVTDDDSRSRIEKAIKRLSQKARAAGIHLILSTQKPVVTVVNTVVKGNLPGRIALRVNSGGESRVILDSAGAEQLVGKGDAILKAGSATQRLQFARCALDAL